MARATIVEVTVVNAAAIHPAVIDIRVVIASLIPVVRMSIPVGMVGIVPIGMIAIVPVGIIPAIAVIHVIIGNIHIAVIRDVTSMPVAIPVVGTPTVTIRDERTDRDSGAKGEYTGEGEIST